MNGNSKISDYLSDKYNRNVFIVQPSSFQFCGTDPDEPIVCSYFGCKLKLSNTERLSGTTCIHHQEVKKIDPTIFISHPQKKTA